MRYEQQMDFEVHTSVALGSDVILLRDVLFLFLANELSDFSVRF